GDRKQDAGGAKRCRPRHGARGDARPGSGACAPSRRTRPDAGAISPGLGEEGAGVSDPLTTEIVRLRDDEDLTFEEISKRVGMHPEACRGRYRRAQKRANRTYKDRREPPDAAALDAFYQAIKNVQSALDRLEIRQTEVTFQPKETKPFGIAWWGDWH